MKEKVDKRISEQIHASELKYDEAFNKSDAAAVSALFTEDAVQVTPEGVFTGRKAIGKRYAESVFEEWHCTNHLIKIEQILAVENGVCAIGEWSCDTRNSDESTKRVNGYYSTVFVREDNTWMKCISTYNRVAPR
jgi:uncharacterized protein (TIGR02246 family)